MPTGTKRSQKHESGGKKCKDLTLGGGGVKSNRGLRVVMLQETAGIDATRKICF